MFIHSKNHFVEKVQLMDIAYNSPLKGDYPETDSEMENVIKIMIQIQLISVLGIWILTFVIRIRKHEIDYIVSE